MSTSGNEVPWIWRNRFSCGALHAVGPSTGSSRSQGIRIPVSGSEPIEYTVSAGALPRSVKRAFTEYE